MDHIRENDGRWAVLKDVTKLRARLGLTPASLQVLTALLSFLPAGRFGKGEMVVFPSNETLALRAGEMNERTLRRHLSRLVEAGLITRAASANGKRFCKRGATGEILFAFGLSLAPLYNAALKLASDAEALREEEFALKALRSRLAAKIARLPAQAEALRKTLRRKLGFEELCRLEAQLPAVNDEMSASDGQNVRHIEITTTEEIEDSTKAELASLNFTLCKESLEPVLSLSADRPKSWEDLIAFAEKITSWVEILPSQVAKARQSWGRLGTALMVLSLATRSKTISRPRAYLDALLQNPAKVSFTALMRLCRKEFTAVNS